MNFQTFRRVRRLTLITPELDISRGGQYPSMSGAMDAISEQLDITVRSDIDTTGKKSREKIPFAIIWKA